MELDATLIGVQSVLKNAAKTTEDFTKIRYKGGNEMKISFIIKDLENFLASKNFIEKRKHNPNFYNELKNITHLLTFNTQYKSDLLKFDPENTHMHNMCPTLSKCLLANIVIELDLVSCYCDIIQNLPLDVTEELLNEFIPCLKKAPAQPTLKYSCLFVKDIIKKLNEADYSTLQNRESADKLTDIGIEMLLTISTFQTDELKSWKKVQMYQHMGYSLLELLKLLELCNPNEQAMMRFISSLAEATANVLKAVTISVYCIWAETLEDGLPLQTIVQEKAYFVKEKYKDVEVMKTLNEILSNMARKPKSLSEKIRDADIDTIIRHVNIADQDQKRWFIALLNTQVFKNAAAIECVEKWSHLCSVDDMNRLLSLGVHVTCQEMKSIIINCLNNFSFDDIILIMISFTWEHKFTYNFETKNMHNSLKVLLNKIHGGGTDYEKDLLILFIQNPAVVLKTVYEECLKSITFTKCLHNFFEKTRIIIQIDNLAFLTFSKVLKACEINDHNIRNCRNLLDNLLSVRAFNINEVICELCVPLVKEEFKIKNYVKVNHFVSVFSEMVIVTEEIYDLLKEYVEILDCNRIKIFEYHNARKDVNEGIIKFLSNFVELYNKSDIELKSLNNLSATHMLNKHYVKAVQQKKVISLYDEIQSELRMTEHAESVAKLMKILPSCITTEWEDLASKAVADIGHIRAAELFTHVLILLSQFATTQENTDLKDYVLPCLSYCLQNYGIILMNIMLPRCNFKDEVRIIKRICHLMKELPNSIKVDESMKLVTLFSDNTLKQLKNDKDFAVLLVAIGIPEVSKLLALKVLS